MTSTHSECYTESFKALFGDLYHNNYTAGFQDSWLEDTIYSRNFGSLLVIKEDTNSLGKYSKNIKCATTYY